MSSAVAVADAAPASTDPPSEPIRDSSPAPSPVPDKMDLTPSPENPLSAPALQSQPMTATASTSSENPPPNGVDAAGAAPYGTRSRNRGARPNYAEDKEIDLEIEALAKSQKSSRRTAGPPSTAASSQEPEVVPVRNGFAAVNSQTAASTGDDQGFPLGGNYNVLPPMQPSKKRKQPGSNTPIGAQHSTVPRAKTSGGSRAHFVETNMMTFEKCRSRLNNKGQLVADDGAILQPNDHLYFVCEPPGEPYYLGRIMEFLHVNNDTNAPVDAVRVNWCYRPKDIQRRVQDTRVVFASMHSDTCPLTSFRGKCTIRHIADIADLDDYRKQRDSFWFDKLYDRYMHRYYEVIPTAKIVNVPKHVKKVLDERWDFVLVEVGRGRDLTSASKMCKRCSDFAANHDSVDCAVCKNTYHMRCVRPPLLKKPARGFAWACAACSRAQELKMEARHTPAGEADNDQPVEEDGHLDDDEDEPPSRDEPTRESSMGPEHHPPPTAAQIAQANLWPWRYLGIHSRPEDALDYDDRIYPRASSRLGPRHQANVNVWHGRPVEFIKPAEGKRKYKPSGAAKKDAKGNTTTDSDKRAKRPKWVLDEPPGYVARGHDEPVELKGKKEYTAQLTFKMPDPSMFTDRGTEDNPLPENFESTLDAYMLRCDQEIAPLYGLEKGSTDIKTKAIEKLQEHNYDIEKAIEAMQHLTARGDLKQPELNREEVKRFEEGVAKYGSELHLVARHVSPNIKESRIVRFYYLWKKSDRGREIWGSYEGRKSKKDSKRFDKDGTGVKLLDDVANDADDSAFDNEKAAKAKRGFLCKFCSTTSSRIWRRAPGTAPGTLVPRDPAAKTSKDRSNWLALALCGKCAYLWRRYAIQYESIEEIGKKIAASGGRASKRKIDEELMRTVLEAQNFSGDTITKTSAQIANAAGVDVPAAMVEVEEPLKKKSKGDKDGATPEAAIDKRKIMPEKPPELEPLKPEAPRVKEHPCAVCRVKDDPNHKMLKCRDCRLHVHAVCYGVSSVSSSGPWYCDMCKNDHNTQVSTNYECVLCPVRVTPQELMEPPRVTHKKKSDREREKERAEREMVQEAGRRWREDQLSAGRPVDPREPLKRTAWNNWMHVNCAVWTKEIKFGDAEHLDAAEGVGFIPRERFDTLCKICKNPGLPTVNCHFPNCDANFHVGCAFQNEYVFGFDITPVKVSRRDSVAVLKLDAEVGLAVPGIWCPNHEVPTKIHGILETTPSGLTALQEYARTYKQVDTSITGTVRRAAQFVYNTSAAYAVVPPPPNRRISAVNGTTPAQPTGESLTGQGTRSSPSPLSPAIANGGEREVEVPVAEQMSTRAESFKKCCSCLVEVSPKWWKVDTIPRQLPTTAPPHIHDLTNDHGPAVAPQLHPMRNDHPAHMNARPQVPINGIVKAEPMDVINIDVPENQDEIRYQCHKCHIQKRTPPSSPSQVRQKERPPPPEAVREPIAYPPSYPPPPAGAYPIPRPPVDGPAHSHPNVNGVITHHSPWQGGPAQWSPPVMRNGNQVHPQPPPPPPPPPAPPVYGDQTPYRHGPPPAPQYGYPYPPPHHAGPYGVPGSLPPPPGRGHPGGPPQHSPPPPPYAHPIHGPPPQHGPPPPVGRPPSPPRYDNRPPPVSPHVAHGRSGSLSRPYPPEQPPRPAEPPGPLGPSGPPYRGYGPPPPPPPPSAGRPPSAQGLAQIAQQAAEQSSHSHSHSRQPSADGMGTPRLGAVRTGGMIESPGLSHLPRPETPATVEAREREREGRSVGPGASASPSLKNLLS